MLLKDNYIYALSDFIIPHNSPVSDNHLIESWDPKIKILNHEVGTTRWPPNQYEVHNNYGNER